MDYNISWAEEEGAWVEAWEEGFELFEEAHVNSFDQTEQKEQTMKETAGISVEQQEAWARADGFSVWDDDCSVCGERLMSGDDCRSQHYLTWLSKKVEEAKWLTSENSKKENARMSHQDDTYQTVVAGVEDVIITGAHMLQFDYRQEYNDGSVHEARIFMHPSQMTAFVEKIGAALEARERFLAALDQEAQ